MKEKITVREAKPLDQKKIAELGKLLLKYDHFFDDTIDLNWLDTKEGISFIKDRIKKANGIVLVAEKGHTIIGYLIGGLVLPHTYRNISVLAELEEIFVLEEHRGNDIGSKLIKSFLKWAKQQKVRRVKITVSESNRKAINLYKRFKFCEYDLILERKL